MTASKMQWRLAVGVIVNVAFLALLLLMMTTGKFRHTRSIPDPFAWELKRALSTLLVILIPSVAVLFLLSVIVKGSTWERLMAVVLSLVPAYIAYRGWEGLIYEFFVYGYP